MPAVTPLVRALFQPRRGPSSEPKGFVLLPGAAVALLPSEPGSTQLGHCPGAAGPGEGWRWHRAAQAAGWDHCPAPLHPLFPLLLSTEEESCAGASCLSPQHLLLKDTDLRLVSCCLLPALGRPLRHQSPIFRRQELSRRMPAARARPLAGGRGSLTPFPRFSLSTHGLVAVLLCCSPPDLARHRMCLTLLLEALAAVSWSQMAAQYR